MALCWFRPYICFVGMPFFPLLKILKFCVWIPRLGSSAPGIRGIGLTLPQKKGKIFKTQKREKSDIR